MAVGSWPLTSGTALLSGMERHSMPGRSNGLFWSTQGIGPTSLPYFPKCRRKSSWSRRLSS
eukprot:5809186-Amphidinium_carterae.2